MPPTATQRKARGKRGKAKRDPFAKMKGVLDSLLKLVCQHPKADKDAFVRLTQHLLFRCTPGTEEYDETVKSMAEIISDAPGSPYCRWQELPFDDIESLNAGTAEPRTEELRKWTRYVSKRVKRFRNEKGWTQEQLAHASGLPQSHISRIENGVHSPSHRTMVRLEKALGLSAGMLSLTE